MSKSQPEALRLANILQTNTMHSQAVDLEAAAHLRRLHDENKLLKATQYGSGRRQELRDVRDKLLAENEDFRATCDHLTRENAEQIGEIVALKEQRDELLNAVLFMLSNHCNHISRSDVNAVRAAIAKAGGAA